LAPSSAIRRALLGLLAATALALGARALALAQGGEPAIRRDEGYVGAEACGECHARQHATWHASYHRTMTTAASPSTALAPFTGRTPELGGVAWLLETEGDALFATPVARDGRSIGQRGRVALITGSHHYQIYWLAAADGGGLTPLPLVWHRAEARFVPRTSMFLMPRSSETVQETGRWETTCIKCHTTNGTGAPPPDGKPTVAALGIECEACHGPGAAHVAARKASGATEPPAVPGAARDEIVFPGELSHARSSEICGQCHAIRPLATPEAREAWRREGFAYRPGDELEATRPLLVGTRERNSPELRGFLDRNPKTLAELFWKDGEVRVSGREFNGLVESPCFQRGNLACISCHEMHPSRTDPRDLSTWADDQLRRGMDGPGACLGCHAELADAERLRAHTHHDAGSSGSDCLNCHMPRTTYGLTKAIRSHEISSPEVAVALASGRPNACNLCHLDRPLGWTADLLRDWYGHERPALEPDRESVAESVLWALEGDAGLRALAACALEWPPAREVSGTGWMPPLQSTLLLDGYDAVRWIALRGLRLEPRFRDFDLDFTADLEAQRNAVRERVLADWRARGLEAAPDRREAVLVRPDGTLDEPRFLRIFARRDDREVRLAE
jgi:hypothetical protein